jgi:hypothetical protein
VKLGVESLEKGRKEIGKRSFSVVVDYQDMLKVRVQKIKLSYCSSSELIDEEETPQ